MFLSVYPISTWLLPQFWHTTSETLNLEIYMYIQFSIYMFHAKKDILKRVLQVSCLTITLISDVLWQANFHSMPVAQHWTNWLFPPEYESKHPRSDLVCFEMRTKAKPLIFPFEHFFNWSQKGCWDITCGSIRQNHRARRSKQNATMRTSRPVFHTIAVTWAAGTPTRRILRGWTQVNTQNNNCQIVITVARPSTSLQKARLCQCGHGPVQRGDENAEEADICLHKSLE